MNVAPVAVKAVVVALRVFDGSCILGRGRGSFGVDQGSRLRQGVAGGQRP